MRRSIIIFSKFEELQTIQDIRKKYDLLATCIAPHITIVFPFESNILIQQLK